MGIHSHRKSEKRKIDMKLFIFLQLNALTYAWTVLPPGGDVYDYGFDYSTSDLVESSKRPEEFLERLEETFDFIDKTVWTRSHYFWEFFFGEKSDCVFNCTIEVDRKSRLDRWIIGSACESGKVQIEFFLAIDKQPFGPFEMLDIAGHHNKEGFYVEDTPVLVQYSNLNSRSYLESLSDYEKVFNLYWTCVDADGVVNSITNKNKEQQNKNKKQQHQTKTTSSKCSSCEELGFTTETNTDYWGGDIAMGEKSSFASCSEWCAETPNCEGATYNSYSQFCYLKDTLTANQYWEGAITGRKCSTVTECQT